MKAAWRDADSEKLIELGLAPLKKDFPEIYDTLIVNRNNAWMPEIIAMMNTEDIEFILVGALHLVGEDGLLTLLSKQGYTIRML